MASRGIPVRRGAVAILMHMEPVLARGQPLDVGNYLDAVLYLGEGDYPRDLVARGRLEDSDGLHHLLIAHGLPEYGMGGAEKKEANNGNKNRS